jgi:D-3-phosphoglycerate dehydrogenase
VVNSPAGNINAAAEHTIALLMSVARNVPDGCSSIKAGKWERSRLVGVEVNQKVLGIIGLGKVGLRVARMAIGLGMLVHGLDPFASPAIAAAASVTLHTSLPSLLAISDFLTIHTPLIASTRGMISTAELGRMKKGARVLNDARGGMIDEEALLTALESGQIGGAGLDVFSSEPPKPDTEVIHLIQHPKVVATPHLGASTVEAQENVSIDVCTSVLHILQGGLPRSAVNAPLILPEEYKKLQPFVQLVEKMGSLYTQRYSKMQSQRPTGIAVSYDLIYEGEIAAITNTRPLYAALVKGLTKSISSDAGTNVNIVNADLIARERGIMINESHSRDPITHNYSSLVTLRARPSRSSSQERLTPAEGSNQVQEQVISGFCSDSQIFISRIDRFSTSFVPNGTLLICHNYDSPGKIGAVGSLIGRSGVNISSMSVAPVSEERDAANSQKKVEGKTEALMILGVDREIDAEVVKSLEQVEGILAVSTVSL